MRLRSRGMEWAAIAAHFPAFSIKSCQAKFHNERKKDVYERQRRQPRPIRVELGRLERERNAREQAREQQSITGAVFGDPPPGFSALDRRRHA